MNLETLEARRMLSISLIGKTLRVTGTQGDDLIWFGEIPIYTTGNSTGMALTVHVNDEQKQFNFFQVRRIVVTSDGGNDNIYVPRLFEVGSFHPLGQPFEAGWRKHVSIPASINGGAGNDTITGGGANDTLRGGAGNDRLDGQTGDDLLFGDSGKDTLVGGLGADIFSGGKHTDTADYSARRDDLMVIMLSEEPGFEGFGVNERTPHGGYLEGDVILRDVENLIGGRGNDTLHGNAADNYIFGGAGDDYITGGNADDTLDGGAGDDEFRSWDLDGSRSGNVILHSFQMGYDLVIGGGGLDKSTTDSRDTHNGVESVKLEPSLFDQYDHQ